MRVFPLSRKLVTAVLTQVLLIVVGIVANKLAPGTPVPPEVLAFVPLLVGGAVGWAVKEIPDIVAAKGGDDNPVQEIEEAANEQAKP